MYNIIMRPGRENSSTLSHRLVPLPALLMLLAALSLRVAARTLPGFANRYAEYCSPILVNTLGRLSALLPCSLAELLLLAALPLAFLLLWRRRLLRALIYLLPALFLLFELNEDIYFSRTGFASTYQLERGDYSDEELYGVCRELVAEINQYAGLVPRNADGMMQTEEALPARMCSAMQALGQDYPCLSGWYPRPKAVLCSSALSRMDLTGIYSIFTIEANYNRDMPPYNIPFTIAHELSHLKGIMSEKEANFIGYLACRRAPEPDLRYSAAMLGWIYCGNELARRNAALWRRAASTLDIRAEQDLRYNSAFWKTYEGRISETAQTLNDRYLKAEGLSEGTRSYELVVDLIVSYELRNTP